MLVDRRKVKFWQKIIFSLMAVIMVAFLLPMAFLGSGGGCGGGASSALDQYNEDIAAGESAVKADPKDAEAWKSLGENYVLRANQQAHDSAEQRADWEKGAAAYSRAASLETKQGAPRSVRLDTLEQLAGVYSFLEAHDKAVQAHARITELSPKDPQAFLGLAYAAISADDTHTAVLAFTRFLELDPKSADAPAVKQWIKQNTKSTKSTAPKPAKDSGS